MHVSLWPRIGKLNKFKYRELLKKQAYCRTHNYRLLGKLVNNGVLVKDRKGIYRLPAERLIAAERAIALLKEADNICKELSRNAQSQECPHQWNNIL